MQRFFIIILVLISVTLQAEEGERIIPMEADQIEYEGMDEAIVKALGKVKIIHGKQMLFADKVTYYVKLDKVIAEGNVIMIDQEGNTVNATKLELTDKMKLGIIYAFKLRFPDNSLLQGDTAQQVSENITTLNNAFYTPCEFICGETKPVWSVRSGTATMDHNDEAITYRNVFFDVYGLPVLYSPFFYLPSPNAKRKSGFLVPSYVSNTYLKQVFVLPYYYNIAPNKDLTVSEMYSSERGSILLGNYRHLLENGSYTIKSSITKRSNKKDDQGENGKKLNSLRGHIFTKGKFQLPSEYETGFDINLATDRTYLDNYKFKEQVNTQLNTLTSNIYVNKFSERSVFKVDALYFQSLQSDHAFTQTPYALPLAKFYHETESFSNGSKFIFDSNLLSLHQKNTVAKEKTSGINRISLSGIWQMPLATESGHMFNLSSQLRSDIYHYNHFLKTSRIYNGATGTYNATRYNGTRSRIIPSLSLDWRYPLINKNKNYSVLLEPISTIILNPRTNYNKKIYNEDSQFVEINDSNLFAPNLSSGIDLVEFGPRISYGLKSGIYDKYSNKLDFIIGQSYLKDKSLIDRSLYRKADSYPYSETHFSDYVGRVSFNYQATTQIIYRFILAKDNLKLKRSEIGLQQSFQNFNVKLDYIDYNDDVILYRGKVKNPKQLYAEANMNYNDWTYSVNMRRNMTKKFNDPDKIFGKRIISTGASIKRSGQCVDHLISYKREFSTSVGVKPSSTWMYEIGLKNLGNIQQNF